MCISECSLEVAGQEEGQAWECGFILRMVRRSREEGGAPTALVSGG